MAYKKFDELKHKMRKQVAEQKWLDSYRPTGRVSGRYLYPVPDYVYEGVGGFKTLDRHPRNTDD